MLLSPNSSWFKQSVLILISSRFYGGTKGQTYQGEFTSPTSLSSQGLCVLWKEQSKAKTELINKNSCLAVLSSFVRFSGYMAFFSCLFCIVFCFAPIFPMFCVIRSNPHSHSTEFFCCCFLLSVFPWSFCLVWFILCCFLDQLYEGGSVWTFGLSVLPFKWKCRSGYTPFLDRPKCSLKEPKARIPLINEFSVSMGVTGHKISQIAIANSMWVFSSNPITSTPPIPNGLPAVSS